MSGSGGFLRCCLPPVAVGAALVGALWLGARDATDAPAPATLAIHPMGEADRGARLEVAPPQAEAAPAMVWAATALARPLFDPLRRPSPGEGPAATAELPRLTGVLYGPQERLAIFAGAAGGKPLVLREGDAIAPYVLLSIHPGEAVLAGPQGPHVLRPGFQDGGVVAGR